MIVAKAVNMAEMMKVPMLGIVENMSYIVCPDCGKHINVFGNSHVDEVAAKHQPARAGQVPHRPAAGRALRCRHDRDLRRRVSGRCRRCLRKAAEEVNNRCVFSVPFCVGAGPFPALAEKLYLFAACRNACQNGEADAALSGLFVHAAPRCSAVLFRTFCEAVSIFSSVFLKAFSASACYCKTHRKLYNNKVGLRPCKLVSKGRNPGRPKAFPACPLCGEQGVF